MDFIRIPPAATKYGQSVSVGCKVMPELHRDIMPLIHSGRISAYKTPSDLIRHAIDQHLKNLNDMDPGLIETDVIDLMVEITLTENRAIQLAQTIRDSEDVLIQHIREGRMRDAQRFLEKLASTIYRLPDGEMQEQGVQYLQKYDYVRTWRP